MIETAKAAAAADTRIHLTTRFGDFDADARALVSFPAGLPGFEQCRQFAILYSAEAAPLQCLHAVGGPPASFLTLDPRLVLQEYRCALAPADRARLAVGEDVSGLLWLAILTITEQGAAFANLRAPVVINPATMTGFQVMPRDSVYPLRYPVAIG
jgi:flagellar assembly factor FliW